MHSRYAEWIDFVFDHEVTSPQWYFSLNAPEFPITPEETTDLLALTFGRAGTDLIRFTDAQVNQGIWFLASATSSDFLFALKDDSVSIDKRVQAVESIYRLYADCFTVRCTETLSHIDEAGSDLNSICYMFWDICPLAYLKNATHREQLEEAVFAVLGRTLEIPHRACREAALHGLGEFACFHPRRVRTMINRFLSRTAVDPILRTYAERAREGNVL